MTPKNGNDTEQCIRQHPLPLKTVQPTVHFLSHLLVRFHDKYNAE